MLFNEDLTPVDIENRRKRIRWWFICSAVLLIVFGIGYWRLFVPVPVDYKSEIDHFKYGSIGSDTRSGGGGSAGGGIPFRVWQVLPSIFPEYLPNQGEQYLAIPAAERDYLDAYASFGFLVEPDRETPIGFSLRRDGVKLIGLNCAVCHTSTVQVAEADLHRIYGDKPLPSLIESSNQNDDPLKRAIIVGMPANTVDLGAYFAFLFRCAEDVRFNKETILAAIKKDSDKNGDIGLIEKLGVKQSITRLRNVLQLRKQQLHYLALLPHGENEPFMPRFGPGRVDTFTPYKSIQFQFPWDGSSGIADFPSIWNQRPREGLQLHWDGNNKSVFERNISASLGAGATPNSLDMHRMLRVAKWIGSPPPPKKEFGGNENESVEEQEGNQKAYRLNPTPNPGELQIPGYPFAVDRALAKDGKAVYDARCYSCHGWTGAKLGHVVDIDDINTDPARLDSYTEEFRANQSQLGAGKWWHFKNFTKTNGYANAPLDGIWARAPYLHNGSVPSLVDLLNRPCTTPELKALGISDADAYEKLIQNPEEISKLIQKARAKNLRPPVFYRGDDRYDDRNIGFRCDSERKSANGTTYTDKTDDGRRMFVFSTIKFDEMGDPVIDTGGNGNQGHVGKEYGTSNLTQKQKEALLEYLKLIDDANINSD